MKRKIISLLSYTTLAASTLCAIIMPAITLDVLPCCLWVLAVLTSTVGLLWLHKKTPGSGNSRRAHRKFYNIIIAEGRVLVNGKDI